MPAHEPAPGTSVVSGGKTRTPPLKAMVFSALLAALMAAGAYIIVPVGPVPIVLSNLFVLLAGLLLGPRWGVAGVALYLGLGAVGLPVFAGGGGGFGHLAGPTGGYLLGYLPAAFLVGLLSTAGAAHRRAHRESRERLRGGDRILVDLTALVCGSIVIYGCGILWLVTVGRVPMTASLAMGILPFLPGDALKIAAALTIARFARPLVEENRRWR